MDMLLMRRRLFQRQSRKIIWNQLVPTADKAQTTTSQGITTKVQDGVTFMSGTPNATTSSRAILYGNVTRTKGHKYLAVTDGTTSGFTRFRAYGIDLPTQGTILNQSSTATGSMIVVGYTINVPVSCEMAINVFDLTLMFGEGNEPTVGEFLTLFPDAGHYPYNPGEEREI